MKKAVYLILLFVSLMFLANAAFAVLINLSSADVAQLGGTPVVDVQCPANPCQITRVTWVLTSSAPYQVDRVNIEWQTAKTSGATYTVYVNLYDNANNIITGGTASQSASATPVTTTVDVVPNVAPRDVYRIEVVIVEQ
ncbi:MAG: hypothetical protein QXF45_07785 [Candidatus Caldarchaeum sp.]